MTDLAGGMSIAPANRGGAATGSSRSHHPAAGRGAHDGGGCDDATGRPGEPAPETRRIGMAIGPVQLLVLGFEKPEFSGEIVAELQRLRDSDMVRVIDALA